MFLNPQHLIKQIKIKDDAMIADFGCGHGGFSIPLAKASRKGKVFAIDIQKENLSFLEARKETERAGNIKTILSDLESPKGSKLGDSQIDLVVIANVLFLSDNRLKIMQEARRILKNNGQVLIVDWKEDKRLILSQGSVGKEEIMELAKDVGLSLEKELDAGITHFALLFHKQ
jgi:ubiquinone/menaquinone biosynthesis C-methylase UbiE